jgi:hypothetical protein
MVGSAGFSATAGSAGDGGATRGFAGVFRLVTKGAGTGGASIATSGADSESPAGAGTIGALRVTGCTCALGGLFEKHPDINTTHAHVTANHFFLGV